jgi:GDP-L-fucose synthase
VNLYGPGGNFDPETSRVIPALIRKVCGAAAEGRDEVEVWGSGRATREFLYVDDAAEGIVRAAERDVSRLDGQARRGLDVSRAERLFGCRASTPLAQDLRTTVEEYRARDGA